MKSWVWIRLARRFASSLFVAAISFVGGCAVVTHERDPGLLLSLCVRPSLSLLSGSWDGLYVFVCCLLSLDIDLVTFIICPFWVGSALRRMWAGHVFFWCV